eukprot:1474240-Rhodomonas_salina.1
MDAIPWAKVVESRDSAPDSLALSPGSPGPRLRSPPLWGVCPPLPFSDSSEHRDASVSANVLHGSVDPSDYISGPDTSCSIQSQGCIP